MIQYQYNHYTDTCKYPKKMLPTRKKEFVTTHLIPSHLTPCALVPSLSSIPEGFTNKVFTAGP